jgi:hypothetical protein
MIKGKRCVWEDSRGMIRTGIIDSEIEVIDWIDKSGRDSKIQIV